MVFYCYGFFYFLIDTYIDCFDTLTEGGSLCMLDSYVKLLVPTCDRDYACKRVVLPSPFVSIPINGHNGLEDFIMSGKAYSQMLITMDAQLTVSAFQVWL